MKLKETRILDAEGARYACIANDYCTRCDCEEYDRILANKKNVLDYSEVE